MANNATESRPVDRYGRFIPDGSWPPGKEAPGRLERLRRFLNTVNPENGADLFETAEDLDLWLAAEGRPAVSADDEELRRVVELRAVIRQMAITNHDSQGEAEAWARFHEAAGGAVLTIGPTEGGAGLVAAEPGVPGLVADLAGIVVIAAAEGTWSRLKACSNSHCRWAFWDRSRSRTGAWCSMSACGQRAKQRAYRRRQSGD